MKYNGYNIPDAEIDKLMENLDISLAEACETWLADNDKIENEEQNALDKTAKGKRRYEKSGDARKKSTKERKVDETKRFLLEIVQKALENGTDCVNFTVKTETELSFSLENAEYTLKLTKHRPKK